MEQLDYNLLFRWFVGLSMDDPVWDVTVFTKNRERLLRGDVAEAFFQRVLELARAERLLSDEHFTVDGTLIEAWAGQKSFVRKGTTPPPPDDPGNPTVNFHGEKRSNATHASTTDSDARLFKKAKGHEAKLCYLGHVLMENRHGLVVNTRLTGPRGGPSGRPRGRWRADSRAPSRDARRGQALRRSGLRRGPAHAQRDAARRPEGDHRARRAHHAPRRLRGQPAVPQARRGSVRLVEDGGAAAARRGTGAASASAGCSPSRWRSTTWCGCGPSGRWPHEEAGTTAAAVGGRPPMGLRATPPDLI